MDFASFVDQSEIGLPIGDVIGEETLNGVGHGTLQSQRADGRVGTNAARAAAFRRPGRLLMTYAAIYVPTIGQGEGPTRGIVGNHAQRKETFVAVKKIEAIPAAALATGAADDSDAGTRHNFTGYSELVSGGM